MGVIRAEPARVTDWAAKSVGAVWRAFDLQLVTYAGLLAAIGLVMAYTNSVENGSLTLETQTTFTRGLMWAGIAVVAFILATAFDYRWLKTLAWPIYVLQLGLLVLTLLIGDGVGGSSRWVSLGPLTFQFSELAKILMIIVLANYLGGTARPAGLAPGRSSVPACWSVPPLVLVMLQPDLGTSLVFGGDPRRDALDVRRQPASGWPPWRPRSSRSCRSPGPTSSTTTRSSGYCRSSTPARTSRAPATSSTRHRSRSGRAAGWARA